MNHDLLLIGSYHKTGTVWLQRVFRDVAENMQMSFTENLRHTSNSVPEAGIYSDDHCKFSDDLLQGDYAGLRMIRDPRDVVISGTHYHMKSHESWLHNPMEDLDGQTYQQALLAQSDMAARYNFEMQRVANATAQEMAHDCVRLSDFITVRYETWMQDTEMTDFRQTMRALGLTPDETSMAADCFYRWSLFGKGAGVDDHARSGKVAQWRSIFSRSLGEAFIEVQGDALITLGYEKDHDWVLRLPDKR